MPPGPHKMRIELVNAIHQGVPEQSKTVTFTIPARERILTEEVAEAYRLNHAASAKRREVAWPITDRSS